MRTKIYFEDSTKMLLLLLLVFQLFFSNGILLFAGLAIFFILISNLQQPFKPSVFSIILLYHFIQISAGIWQCNFLEKDINYRATNTFYAVLMSYIGLLFLFLPIIYYQNKIPSLSKATLLRHADKLSLDKTFRVYVISFFVMNALTGIAFLIPSLAQIIFSLGNIKWFMFILFGLQSILKNRKRKEFYIFCSLEFAMGFYSYFSEFKTVLFFIFFLALMMLTAVRFNKLLVALFSVVTIVFAGIFWTGIKGEYRQFINKGSKSQTVQVEKGEALNKLLELSERQDKSTFQKSTEDFLDRLQYTYHLAKAMDRVPAIIPYQNGDNWATTLSFVLTPRILDPNKGTYDASVKASKYTGIQYQGIKRGTSVSLGYFADGYIDFGYIGMFIPILILGFIYGSTYFYFVKKSSNNFVFNYSVVAAVYMELFAFESDGIFVAGRLYVNLLVFFILSKTLFPRLINYLSVPTTKAIAE
jgi:hypothetical protein